MKYLFTLLIAAAAFCGLSAADLSDRIPADAKVVLGFDAKKALSNPMIAPFQEKFVQELVKAGLDANRAPESYAGNAILFVNPDNQDITALIETKDVTLDNVAKYMSANGKQAKIEKFGKFDGINTQPGDPDPGLLIALETNLFLLCDKSKLENYTSNYAKNADLKKLYDTTKAGAMLRIAAIINPAQLPPNAPKIKSAVASFDMDGEDGAHMTLLASSEALSDEDGAKAQLSAQQAVLVASMLMAEQPELFNQFAKAVKITRDKTKVSIAIDLPGALTKQLAAFAAMKAAQTQAQKAGDAAPGTAVPPVAPPATK